MYDNELEKAILYYLIFEQEEYCLDENDFVNKGHRQIINTINELKAEKKPVSILTIQSKIKVDDKEKVLEYLSNLGKYIRTSSADSVYNSLIELSKKRKLLKLVQEKEAEIQNCENIDILSQELIKQVNQIEQINEKEKTFVEQVVATIEQIEKNTKEKTDYSLYTGLGDLDNITCGLHKEELTIIGARPRCRKNNICITNSRTYCEQRNRNSNNKLRNVRLSNYTKNASKKNKN